MLCKRLVFLVLVAANIGGSRLCADLAIGTAKIDISPTEYPVRRNGGFIEAVADHTQDPLHVRCLVLEQADDSKARPTRIAIAVVDSCMIDVQLCDKIKQLASADSGIPSNRILISATHTHSAPSVMDFCLGSRADPKYPQSFAPKVAAAIIQASQSMQAAKVGWGVADAGAFNRTRRWVTRPDKRLADPFGQLSVRAMMHPGYQNPDYLGPSGPRDPWLSIVSFRSIEGMPLAVLANYSMHYFAGHRGLSADYFGRYAGQLESQLAPNDKDFLAIMSQGTSGDTWWGDYRRAERRHWTIDEYTDGLVAATMDAYREIEYEADVPVRMAERRITLQRRLPDPSRVAWANNLLQQMKDRRPENRPEVYAEQAIFLRDNPNATVVLQAIRIGQLGITAMPNEVYSITGLKLKAFSPLPTTFNIELANGASGYIPPTEQHALGGYTTWPARTAGLEVAAESKITNHLLELLEEVSGAARKLPDELPTDYSQAVAAAKPIATLRMNDLEGPLARDTSGNDRHGRLSGPIAYYLAGVDVAGTKPHSSRAIFFAGGVLQLEAGKTAAESGVSDYSVEMWFHNYLDTGVRPITGTIFEFGSDRLVLDGKGSGTPGRLRIGPAVGTRNIPSKSWHHLAVVREGDLVRVHVDGDVVPDLTCESVFRSTKRTIYFGNRSPLPDDDVTRSSDDDTGVGFQGLVDEISVFDRALTASEILTHFKSANLEKELPSVESPPLGTEEALQSLHVRNGYQVELVAAEPLVRDPVAIDWGPDGKLWVAEMADYPYGADGNGQPCGRIRYLVDTDQDGKYDESFLFLEDVTFPTGVIAWRDGVIVTAAPSIFYAADSDGDGRADIRQELFEGFIEGNQQLRVNGPRWGLDNWIYCASGGHHAGFGAKTKITITSTQDTIDLGSRDFRFHPTEHLIEARSGPSQFGRIRDDRGNWFGVQNSHPLWHFVLEDHYLKRNAFAAAPDPRQQLRPPLNPPVFSGQDTSETIPWTSHVGAIHFGVRAMYLPSWCIVSAVTGSAWLHLRTVSQSAAASHRY